MILFQISNSLYLFYVFIFCIIKLTQFAQNTDIKNAKVIRGLVKNGLLDKINNEKWLSDGNNTREKWQVVRSEPRKKWQVVRDEP